ncbi:MAG TPA: hypothetical protein VG406_03730 [Isosphaeraceae bacterium]|jgi:hypothetical protein|nr:hypothetical protein [Isosphaeraceae bacterium]
MMPIQVDKRTMFEVFDDFDKLDDAATTGRWQIVKGTGGTLALANVASGALNVPTAALANDYQLLATQQPSFKIAAEKGLFAEARLTCAEANTNQANWFFGLISAPTSGFLQASNAGPPSSYDGVVLYKAGGQMALKLQTSHGTTQQTSTVLTLVSGQSYRVGFIIDPPQTGAFARVTAQVYDETAGKLYDWGAPPNLYMTIPTASPVALYGAFGVMAGSGSAETLQVDYVRFLQPR